MTTARKPAPSAEQKKLASFGFPQDTKLRELIRTTVDGKVYVLFGFRSGESLCLRLKAVSLGDKTVGDRIGKLPTADVRPTWYEQRVDPGAPSEDRQAALQTARHADTPTIVRFDPLGRPILTVTCNRYQRQGAPVEDRAGTFVDLDIEGFERAVWDAFDREVIRYHYDLRGRRVCTMSMDSGARWTLADVMDQPIAAWDSRGSSSA